MKRKKEKKKKKKKKLRWTDYTLQYFIFSEDFNNCCPKNFWFSSPKKKKKNGFVFLEFHRMRSIENLLQKKPTAHAYDPHIILLALLNLDVLVIVMASIKMSNFTTKN